MPFVLPGVTTPDDFDIDGLCRFQPSKNTVQITFAGADADYIARFYKINPSDRYSEPTLDGYERIYLAGTGDNLVSNIGGVDFRSAVQGVPARIYGQQAFATDVISAVPLFGGAAQPAAVTEASAVSSGQVVGTNGTPTPLSATSVPCLGVAVKSAPTNTGLLYVGGPAVTVNNGYVLAPDDAVAMDIDDLDAVFFDCDLTGDVCTFLVLL